MLALLGTYARADCSPPWSGPSASAPIPLNAVERILAVQAQPKSVLESLADQERRHLPAAPERQPGAAATRRRLPPALSRNRPIMARRQQTPATPPTHAPNPATTAPADLRERILADFAALKVPLRAEQLDAVLAAAERDGLSHLEFLHRLIAEQADQRRERSIARRIREARFRERQAARRASTGNSTARPSTARQIEELATAAFIRRRDNLVMVGQSGVGKAFLIQAIGQAACVARLLASATPPAPRLLDDLTASLADQTLPQRVRYYARFDLLVIDEFGFDQIERERIAAGRQPLLQDHRRPQPAAFDRSGDQHRLQRLGRVPRRSAVGHGLPRPHRRRRHHPEDQGQILPRSPGQFAKTHRQPQSLTDGIRSFTGLRLTPGCESTPPGNVYGPTSRPMKWTTFWAMLTSRTAAPPHPVPKAKRPGDAPLRVHPPNQSAPPRIGPSGPRSLTSPGPDAERLPPTSRGPAWGPRGRSGAGTGDVPASPNVPRPVFVNRASCPCCRSRG